MIEFTVIIIIMIDLYLENGNIRTTIRNWIVRNSPFIETAICSI